MGDVYQTSLDKARGTMARPRGPLNPERTKQAILDAATLSFARNGYSGTVLPEVAKEAGISAPSLLYHFGSKELLLDTVLRRAWQEVRDDLRPRLLDIGTPAEALAAGFASLFAAESSTGSLHAQISAAVIGQRGVGTEAIRDTLMPLLDDIVQAMVSAPRERVGPTEKVRALLIYILTAHASAYLLEDRVPDDITELRANEIDFALALLESVKI
jgi:AcrR family transcriptional regulator